jgi:hypothetical protein
MAERQFTIIPNEAVSKLSDLSRAAIVLFIYYCRKSDGKGKPCYRLPAADEICDQTGLGRRVYFDAKKELERWKWIAGKGRNIVPIKGLILEPEKVQKPALSEPEKSAETRTISKPRKRQKVQKPALKSAESRTRILRKSDNQTNTLPKRPNDPSKKAKGVKQDKPKSDHALGMEFLWGTIGPQPDGAAQATSLSWMLKNGFTLDEIKHYLPDHVRDYDQKGLRPSYNTLQKQITGMRRKFPMPKPPEEGGIDYTELAREANRAAVERHQRKNEQEK